MALIYSKKQLFTKFWYFPTNEVRTSINAIISKNRAISLEQAKLKRNVRPNEVTLFCKEYDVEDINAGVF